jgi:hypothetical protein
MQFVASFYSVVGQAPRSRFRRRPGCHQIGLVARWCQRLHRDHIRLLPQPKKYPMKRSIPSNQTLEATADDALGLPLSTRLLTSSVGGASVLRSAL